MKLIKILAILSVVVCQFHCGNNTVTNTTSLPVYNQILSTNISGYNVRMFIANGDSLTTGYNDIYFKVSKNSAELNKGLVKLYPIMHMTLHLWHSTPVSTEFIYDNKSGYFKGNAIFNMATTPPFLVWKSVITYHDENGIDNVSDSIPTYTVYHPEKQWSLFADSTEQTKYYVSLLKPFTPAKQLNDIWMVLYKSDDLEQVFQQLNDPIMNISVYKSDTLSIQSTGNINPAADNNGIYKGKINLPYNGLWKVCDTIYYHGHYITNNPPPMPVFSFDIH
jgi:hypothetical protein